ncbi:nucleotide exchange factor GrpE [Candidatus Berkelbacteria bacterium CG_4_10_14_0_8_um_filter_35_9_33_8]|uniref:Protein GrpE n=1 Tax=Candidatus Berkelbacteria bacterium CG_4_10_14_0_2_um_filter_35_9_33_12 TaxID=1974499 RepID=A0A2M7W4A1_9BACT|nr:MAG: nucleotide exchange factor GrpE [Candidatus Berkelbacteria bacterium CG23_combo_of_CG06-09_8_20_14_all_33_15]PIS08385.1 MAG: nucleotide exchange factor GrpE [Candidatus Berkelbacteria bacterium CG10_big_fil_rev_8_21_14_0_10_33_10]PIZ28404.1 MAG: nucleotide exchange factor GrpE [Candidatus Berkelbacteria bacterium CG_4_10_14_0_8_um_filter_35_9_33_8]PJA20543.1 MAG: nucleotide exchange factor GrpE [Candidatus Berkelbacteria bacterium CG_4_10_14_0_2_um_filter_35_9_33_12]
MKKIVKKKIKKGSKIAELTNLVKIKQAELINLQNRFETHNKSLFLYANENLILDILPILDNFKRSTEHLPKELENNNWAKGINLIEKQLEKMLKNNGLEKIITQVGDNFDPSLHDAIEGESEKISEIVLDGYKLNSKVIRPAKVKVN